MSLYLQPKTLDELRETLSTLPERTLIMAGGTDLMPKLRTQRPEYDCMLSLCGISELHSIEEKGDWLRIGAMVTHAMAAEDERVAHHFKALQMACSHIGSQQIRNKGTLCGSLVNASPAGDIMPCMFLFFGEMEIMGRDGTRRVPAQDFLDADGRPDLRRGEVLTAIWLPYDEDLRSCFVKLGSRTEVTIAQISMCVTWKDGEGELNIYGAYVGAIDRRPLKFPKAYLLGRPETADDAVEVLSSEIRTIRQKRSRPPKLKITEAEQLYKERAAKGIIYDTMAAMGLFDSDE